MPRYRTFDEGMAAVAPILAANAPQLAAEIDKGRGQARSGPPRLVFQKERAEDAKRLLDLTGGLGYALDAESPVASGHYGWIVWDYAGVKPILAAIEPHLTTDRGREFVARLRGYFEAERDARRDEHGRIV